MTDPTTYTAQLITLEPSDYPEPIMSMQTFAPADAAGHLDVGPGYVDRETVQALHDAVASGQFVLDYAWLAALTVESNAVLETKFVERLRRTPLSASSPTLYHRRLALYEAVREIGAEGSIPGFGFGVHNVTRCIGDIETWMEGKRQELRVLGLDDAAVAGMLLMLTPGQLAALLQTSETNLATWRESKRGPAFAKISQRTVRYPVAAVLDWLKGAIAR
jgi:hypothetical protein